MESLRAHICWSWICLPAGFADQSTAEIATLKEKKGDMPDPLADFIHTHAPHLASEVTEDTPLLEQGLLDSLGLMRLVAFLERQYHLVVPEEQIIPRNFRSLASIRKLIDNLLPDK